MNEREAITKDLEELRREILELKARLFAESSLRAQAESLISLRVSALEAKSTCFS